MKAKAYPFEAFVAYEIVVEFVCRSSRRGIRPSRRERIRHMHQAYSRRRR